MEQCRLLDTSFGGNSEKSSNRGYRGSDYGDYYYIQLMSTNIIASLIEGLI
jgi:hypothetical protein